MRAAYLDLNIKRLRPPAQQPNHVTVTKTKTSKSRFCTICCKSLDPNAKFWIAVDHPPNNPRQIEVSEEIMRYSFFSNITRKEESTH